LRKGGGETEEWTSGETVAVGTKGNECESTPRQREKREKFKAIPFYESRTACLDTHEFLPLEPSL